MLVATDAPADGTAAPPLRDRLGELLQTDTEGGMLQACLDLGKHLAGGSIGLLGLGRSPGGLLEAPEGDMSLPQLRRIAQSLRLRQRLAEPGRRLVALVRHQRDLSLEAPASHQVLLGMG